MHVLLAVDDSPHSAAAVRLVEARPWPPDTVVRVLTAVPHVPPPDTSPGYDATPGLDPIVAAEHRYAEEFTHRVAAALNARPLNAEAVVRDGDARLVIVDEARDWPADLIVLGSHGRTGFARWLLGSVAQFVASHAPCSVEIVRSRGTETPQL